MKHPIIIVFTCLFTFSSCVNKQDIIENKVYAQLGDSCVSIVSDLIMNYFKEIKYPPLPPDFLTDIINGKYDELFSLNKYDTLGYPIRFTVYKFNSNVDSTDLKEYYEAFDYQNEIRTKYLFENIVIDDTLQTVTLDMIQEAFEEQDSLIDDFQIDKINIY